MATNTPPVRIGTRGSQLAISQTESAAQRIGWTYELVRIATPGDRDLTTDLRLSPEDFFTRDLDDALRQGSIDCAIHSAKDLPAHLADDIDFFWLPWREEPGDAWVLPDHQTWEDLPALPRIGVSSERRANYVQAKLPAAQLLPIRGAVDSRIAQLDTGNFDAVIIAIAALNRLGLSHRATRPIPLTDLTPPPAQGVLAVTFLKGNTWMQRQRLRFTRAVRFIGAGVGGAELCTLAGVAALQWADICIYDALLDERLLTHLSPTCERIFVGKRSGHHSQTQTEITQLICDAARQGKRVVRLKGGDPGLFGRLSEETDALDTLGLAYRVWPGVSALMAATTPTGILLTRRGISRGFHVMTPRSTGEAMPTICFMALGAAEALSQEFSPDTPIAVVFNAGAPDQSIQRMALADLATCEAPNGAPGLIIVGEASRHGFPTAQGLLASRKVWITASEELQNRAASAVIDRGGIPISQPLVQMKLAPTALPLLTQMKSFDWLIVTSPTAARLLLTSRAFDLRDLPKIAVTGPGTARVFAEHGITIDLMPQSDYSARGLRAILPDLSNQRVLRVRSELAEWTTGTDCILYTTEPVRLPKPPSCDTIFFASGSAIKSFVEQFGADALAGKDILTMGVPSTTILRECTGLAPTCEATTATVDTAIATYAETLL